MNIPDLTQFKRVVFFTGAGMSAESGVPTYRGKGGTWAQYNYEDCACERAFLIDPERVWDFHDVRRRSTGDCLPHDGHRAIASFLAERPGASIVTQNIDGMHQSAGTDPSRIHELHGSLWRVRCDHCGLVEDNCEIPIAPRRHACGAYWRPDIVWFGDSLRGEVIMRAQEVIASCDALVSVGTSAVVYPAAQLPMIAKEKGATLIEVNPEETAMSSLYDVQMRMPASEALAKLLSLPVGARPTSML